MKKKKVNYKEKVKEIDHMAAVDHSQMLGDLDEYYLDKYKAEKQYEEYRSQYEKWELFKEIASACVNKYPTTNDNDIAWVANTAVNLTNLLYSEWKR